MEVVKEGSEGHEADAVSDPDSGRQNERAPLLLHSLAELAPIWKPLFEIAKVHTATEVGSEAGFNTLPLARWLRSRGGGLTVVDPAPAEEVAKAAADGELTIVRGLSPQALVGLPAADAYLIDGDHNYATVLGELEVVAGSSGSPLVILHDIGWPWARRDLYYSPESLEPSQRHPYTYSGGVAPGRTEAFDGGFRGEGEFALARTEGGPCNGVRTAVEDFVAANDGFEFLVVPSVFGLGVLFRSDAPFADEVRAALAPYAGNPLLDRLERNRIELYLKVLELQDLLRERDMTVADLHDRLRAEWRRRDHAREHREQLHRMFDSRESERSTRELALLQRVAESEQARIRAERERDEARAAASAVPGTRLAGALQRLHN